MVDTWFVERGHPVPASTLVLAEANFQVAVKAPWRALLETCALLPVLCAWSFAHGCAQYLPAYMTQGASEVVYIVDYKKAPDGTELLLTNAAGDVVGLSVRRPGSKSWLLCWNGYDDPPFDGEIELHASNKIALVRRERAGDLLHVHDRNAGRWFDWSAENAELCGPGKTVIPRANPITNEHVFQRSGAPPSCPWGRPR